MGAVVSPMRAEVAAELAAPRQVPVIDLMALERCDRCGFRAQAMTLHAGGLPLSWCGHHHRQHAAALTAVSAVFVSWDPPSG